MIKYISNSAHYQEVIAQIKTVKHTLWIGTADIKDLYVELVKTLTNTQFYMIGSKEYYVPECISKS